MIALISVLSIVDSSSALMAHVSHLYNKQLLIHLDVTKGIGSLNFFHAHLTFAVAAASAPSFNLTYVCRPDSRNYQQCHTSPHPPPCLSVSSPPVESLPHTSCTSMLYSAACRLSFIPLNLLWTHFIHDEYSTSELAATPLLHTPPGHAPSLTLLLHRPSALSSQHSPSIL